MWSRSLSAGEGGGWTKVSGLLVDEAQLEVWFVSEGGWRPAMRDTVARVWAVEYTRIQVISSCE